MASAVWARIKGVLRRKTPVSPRKISPINHLPPELLSAIFLHLLPEPGAWDLESIPHILGRVCRLWRTLTLALPSLWASLNITCTPNILHPPLHTIRAHLLRSTTVPLSIIIDTYDPGCSSSSPHPHFPAVLTALVAARNRWRHMSISDGIMQETLDAITQGDAPLLQSLHYTTVRAASQPSIPLRVLQGFPRMESLAWHIPQTPIGPELGDNAWPHLTTLDLSGALTISDCLALLRLSTRLSAATFDGISSLGDTTSDHLLHAILHTLHAMGTHAAMLINVLTLPALVELNLRLGLYGSPAGHDAALPDFLARSVPPLHTLILTHLLIPEAALLRALALVGNLHTLFIDTSNRRMPLTVAFVIALHPFPPPSPPPLCPQLSTLSIDPLDAPDGACAALLRARWGASHGVAGLQKADITLEGLSDGHERDQAEMHALNAEGMVGMLHILHNP